MTTFEVPRNNKKKTLIQKCFSLPPQSQIPLPCTNKGLSPVNMGNNPNSSTGSIKRDYRSVLDNVLCMPELSWERSLLEIPESWVDNTK